MSCKKKRQCVSSKYGTQDEGKVVKIAGERRWVPDRPLAGSQVTRRGDSAPGGSGDFAPRKEGRRALTAWDVALVGAFALEGARGVRLRTGEVWREENGREEKKRDVCLLGRDGGGKGR